MKAFLVTLNFRTRNALPKIGQFLYSPKHKRYAWRGEEVTDAGQLAEYVNEALTFIETLNYQPLIVRVFAFDTESGAIPEQGPEQAQDPTPEQPPVENDTAKEESIPFVSGMTIIPKEPSRPRGRPRKLLTTS